MPFGGAGEDLGGYKGYGWARRCGTPVHGLPERPVGRVICGVDRATGEKKPMPLGHVFMAIDIEPLIGLDKFKANAALLRGLRASTKDPNGPGKIWTAGEPEHDAFQRSYKTGRLLGAARPCRKHMVELRASIVVRTRPGAVHAVPFGRRRTQFRSLLSSVVIYGLDVSTAATSGRPRTAPLHPFRRAPPRRGRGRRAARRSAPGNLLEPSATCLDGLT